VHVAAPADRTLEREANVFAAELVMPEPEVRAAFADDADVGRVAARFGVSPLAVHWRLCSFGLREAPQA
jgi:Zn-dependent peptidase ImmA (M78 family)